MNLDMRSSWIRVTLNPMTSVRIRDRKGEKAERHGEGPVMMGAEIAVMYQQVVEAGDRQ